jgi:hypothetical protein
MCSVDIPYPRFMSHADGQVSTRFVGLVSPAQTVTISIYGFPSDAPVTTLIPAVPAEQSSAVAPPRKEDWSWVSDWAGGIAGLIILLGDDTVRTELRLRALQCLDLLDGVSPVTPHILVVPSAVSWVLSLPPTTSPLVKRLHEDPEFALHPTVRPRLPSLHPFYPLVHGSEPDRRREACKRLDLGRPALVVLAETVGDDWLDLSPGSDLSNLARLLAMGQAYAEATAGTDDSDDSESIRCLELVLDILERAPLVPKTTPQLARRLPGLALVSRVRGSQRTLNLPPDQAGTISRALLTAASSIPDGARAWSEAVILVQPYLPHLSPDDPVRTRFTSSTFVSVTLPDTPDGRRLARLSAAMSEPTSSSSVVHQATPAELVSLLAPSYYKILATAPVPPLGIPSTVPRATPESQASAWAGKVYSEHEFRTREGVGLGLPGGVAPRASRPASRHVDEYAR